MCVVYYKCKEVWQLFTVHLSPPLVFILKCNTLYMLQSKQQAQRNGAKLLSLMKCNLPRPNLTYIVNDIYGSYM